MIYILVFEKMEIQHSRLWKKESYMRDKFSSNLIFSKIGF